MAFPTGTFTAANLASYIPEIWGERINDYFKSEIQAANFFVDRSDELADGGDVLHTPNLSAMTANAKANATAVTLNSATYTSADLTVDQWYEVSFAIEDKEAVQVMRSYYLQDRLARNAGYELAKKLEVAITSLFSSFTTVVGSSVSVLDDTIVRSAIAKLAATGANLGEAAFFIDVAVVWDDLMGLDKFTLAINAPEMSPIGKGLMGKLYGIPLFASNFIQYVSGTSGRNNALAVADAIHFATASLPVMTENGVVGKYGIRVQSSYRHEYLSTLTTCDLLYGVVKNRDSGGVLIRTEE